MQTIFSGSKLSLGPFQDVLKRLLGVLVMVICSTVAHAQVFTNKTTTHGLGSNVVYGVFASGSNVYAATIAGLSISTDGGASFTNKTTSDGLGSNAVYGVFASGSNVYAATDGGLSISIDGGASFTYKISSLNWI
jgi:ABC-type phosphate transport system substrate-binding protein